MVASHAIVTKAVQKDFNAMRPVNVHAMTMLKEDDAIDAKRTNLIAIKAVWIVQIATIWFAMRPMNIARNCPI